MTVRVECANGTFEVFRTDNYKISKPKDFHPLICKVDIFADGVKIQSVKRPFKFIYKHFIFKTEKVQKILVKLNQANSEKTVQEN